MVVVPHPGKYFVEALLAVLLLLEHNVGICKVDVSGKQVEIVKVRGPDDFLNVGLAIKYVGCGGREFAPATPREREAEP